MTLRKTAALAAAAVLAAALTSCSQGAQEEGAVEEGGGAVVEAAQEDAGQKEPPATLDVGRTGYSAGEYATFAFEVTNSSGTRAAELPGFRAVLKGEDGSIVASEETFYFKMQPGETVWFTGMAETPVPVASMDIEPVGVQWVAPSGSAPMECVNVTERADEYGGTVVTGEVSNPNAVPVGSARVDVVFLSGGEVVGSAFTFADNVPGGGSAAFQVDCYGAPAHDEMVVQAVPWS